MRGGDEKARGVWTLRDMATRETREYASIEILADTLNEVLKR